MPSFIGKDTIQTIKRGEIEALKSFVDMPRILKCETVQDLILLEEKYKEHKIENVVLSGKLIIIS